MPAPTCTDTELLKIVKQSGFPFEIDVAEVLQSNGFEVQLSQHFYNSLKQKESEVDILATFQNTASRKTIPTIRLNLELAIECKDNSLPYVLFGFPSPPIPPSGILDMDSRYIKVRSTDDKFRNSMSILAFGDTREEPKRDNKPLLHQFNGAFRFHHATQVEMDGKGESKGFKLHESERLRMSLGGLAGYSEHLSDTWMKQKHILDKISHDPTLWITYFLLVHKGQHFRYTNKNSLEAANHTTLFTSFNSNENTELIAIDFVQYSDLPSAIIEIQNRPPGIERKGWSLLFAPATRQG